MATKVILSLFHALMWYQLSQATWVPVSPCRNLFSYRVNSANKEIIGYIQLTNLNAYVKNTLEVTVSEGSTAQYTSLYTYKTLKSTYNDIKIYGTATYWLKFALQCPLPELVSMSINGKLICSGSPHSSVRTRTMTYSVIPPKDVAAQTIGSRFSAAPPTTTEPVTTFPTPVEKQDMCGTYSVLADLSFNGIPNRIGQFPWIVPLFHHNSTTDFKYFCTGTLVTARYILTAAHCVKNLRPENILAIPGKHNTSDVSATNGATHAYVDRIVCHDDYYGDSEHLVDQDADIAILRLKNSLQFTNIIRPICLWRDQTPLRVNSYHKGFVSGWGETENGSTNIPFYFTSTIVSNQQCSDNIGVSIPNRARLFCGDGSGSVACKGDSGSAMAMIRDNRYYLRGLVSKAILDVMTKKCDTTKYTIYTDVQKFTRWILKHINDYIYDDEDYDY